MHILIIEDETRIAKRIERMVNAYFAKSLNTLKILDNLQDAQNYIQENTLDLVLLDLNLNGESGFEVLKTAVSNAFHTIIISAHSDKAILAFEYGVLDFVSKPFNQERLDKAFQRLINADKNVSVEAKYLAIKKRSGIYLVNVKDVLFIKGAGTYTEVHLRNGDKELHDKSLEKLEQLLPNTFFRTHKSYLVKLTEIKEIMVRTGSKYLAELHNGDILPIGRTKYKELKSKWL